MIVSIFHPVPLYSANEYDIKIGYLFVDVDIDFKKRIVSFYNFEEHGIKSLEDLVNCHIHPSLCRMYYASIVSYIPLLEKVYINELDGILVLEKLYEYIGKINDNLCMDVLKHRYY